MDKNGRTVIGVDDVNENLMIVAAIAEEAGYFFFPVSSGLECLSLVRRVSPQLILLDVQMPVMNGFETCRRLRQIEGMAAVPVAFLTAKKTMEDLQEGIKSGGNDFILKPIDRTMLLARMAYWTVRRVRV